MNPPIPDIFAAASRAMGLQADKVRRWSLHASNYNRCRGLALVLCLDMGYGMRHVCESTGFPEADAEWSLLLGRRLMAKSLHFQESADLARKILALLAADRQRKAQEEDLRMPIFFLPTPGWSAQDERRVQAACVSAALFMRAFGKGKNTHPDALGFYPTCD